MVAQVQFFGLLHLEKGQRSAVNISAMGFDEQLRIYLNNAKILSTSLKVVGLDFTLLTNDKVAIDELDASVDRHFRIQQIEFRTPVPKNISFYSAHFKLDAFRYLGELDEKYAVLCDLDMVCINKIPRVLSNAIEKGLPLAYDISDQMLPAFGHDRILDDLEAITLQKSEGRWMGGEYISGPSRFFRVLASEISELFPNYLRIIDRAHHVGDEVYTSAAIERLRDTGIHVGDAGTLGIVGRYWNVKPLHPQKPFRYFEQCFLLHLPADKELLSSFVESGQAFEDARSFLESYKKYLRNRLRNRVVRRLQYFRKALLRLGKGSSA